LDKQKEKYIKETLTKTKATFAEFFLKQLSFLSSFFLDKKRSKKIKDEGCTSPSSRSYDDRLYYCSLSIYNFLLLALLQSL